VEMISINIPFPTARDIWLKLFRLSYRKLAKPVENMPVGIPGNRDPDNPCYSFAPRPRFPDDWGDCDTDGHYMCDGCVHRKKCDD